VIVPDTIISTLVLICISGIAIQQFTLCYGPGTKALWVAEINIHAGINLHQWDCNTTIHTMLWAWNQSTLGSRDRHICDGGKYCAASPSNVNWNHYLIAYYYTDQEGQRFTFLDSLTYPGFYIIKNDHGKCLSVPANTKRTGAEIWVDDFNPSKAGQRNGITSSHVISRETHICMYIYIFKFHFRLLAFIKLANIIK